MRIARETGWGYTRVLGELKKLTSRKVSRQFVVNVMREEGFDPGPQRGEQTRDGFIRAHAATLCQCDFFSTKVLTWRSWRECFVLVFLHVGTRRVFVSRATLHPRAVWVEEQSRAFNRHVASSGLGCGLVFHDRDTRFTAGFDAVPASGGAQVRRSPVRSPNLQPFVERWVQSIRTECLDHFVALGERHLNYLIAEFAAHYLEERPHQGEGLGNTPLSGPPRVDDTVPLVGRVRCRSRLGGVLKHFYRRAA